MSNRHDKPKMSAADLVKKMRDEKGITFNLVSETEAERYLSDINNYFRTASYRKNYQKYQRGANPGKYIDLDFGYLRELSTIDWSLRRCINEMCLDIEHDLKVRLLKDIEDDPNEDGYQIVEDFIDQNPYLIGKLAPTSVSVYTGSLMRKYLTLSRANSSSGGSVTRITAYHDCPVWAFVEFITFGDFVRLYEFYYSKGSIKRLSTSVMNSVKSLRNACAHNNCILSVLGNRTSFAPSEISRMVSGISSITPSQRRKRLTSRPVMELLCVLYAYKFATSNNDGHESLGKLISLFQNRMIVHKDYFQNNPQLKGYYAFISAIIEYMFPTEFSASTSFAKQGKRSVREIIRSAIKEIFS